MGPCSTSGDPIKALDDLCKQARWGDAFDYVVGLQTLLLKKSWSSCVTNYPRLVYYACADAVRQADIERIDRWHTALVRDRSPQRIRRREQIPAVHLLAACDLLTAARLALAAHDLASGATLQSVLEHFRPWLDVDLQLDTLIDILIPHKLEPLSRDAPPSEPLGEPAPDPILVLDTLCRG